MTGIAAVSSSPEAMVPTAASAGAAAVAAGTESELMG